MNCQREGCKKEATCALGINVPATGWAIDAHKPLHVCFSLVMCDEHYDEIDLKTQFFNLERMLEGIFEAAARMQGSSIPPDFSRAFKNKVGLTSEEFLMLEKSGGRPS